MIDGFGKKGQVTLFVIIAILVIAGIIIYFLVSGGFGRKIPAEMQPVYDAYLSCIEEQARQGIALLGEQGGRIEVKEFVPGSQYMPFSSELNFFGQSVPYWMYVSGNNLLIENVPTRNEMEEELEDYISARLDYCDFSVFPEYDVFLDDGSVKASINEEEVIININQPIKIYFGKDSVFIRKHEVIVKSKLGKFYDLARDVYDYEKKNMFLENYALDVLRVYAPVTGTEITCSPLVFNDEEIRDELSNALSANFGILKLTGSYYSNEDPYFVTDIGRKIDENVNFIYSKNWPTRIERHGKDIIEPVGLQEGMGILGFCYVPYHFVYDITFPVMIQFFDNEELFQFPIAVIIDNNQPRQALPSTAGENIEPEVCKYKNKDVDVNVYDLELNKINADIDFKCLFDECRIGETVDGHLSDKFPPCVNGFIIAKADGYADTKYQISTNEESVANIIMKKKYSLPISINTNKPAMISFESDDYSTTVIYPDFKNIELIEGYYNVSVYVYEDSNLIFPETTTRQCVDVPKSGIGGVFGLEEEKCFDITLPKQEVTYAVIGGGKTMKFFTENMLKESGELRIDAEIFDTPESLEEMQQNYINLEGSVVKVSLR